MSLRFAYNTNGAANHRLDDALLLIAEAGYDGVALTLDHHHHDPFAPDWEAATHRLAARLRELSLGSVIETGARYLLDPRRKHEPTLITPDADGRAARVAFLKRAVDISAILGSEAVSFWAGVPQPGVTRQDGWRWLDEGLEAVCAHADACGVVAAFEPEPGMAVERVCEYETLAARHASLRLALDTGHCIVTGDIDPADAIRRYARRLGTVAVEDMKRGVHVHLPFGTGHMDMPAVLRALEDIRFEGLVCVELSRESPRAHEAIPEAIRYLRSVVTNPLVSSEPPHPLMSSEVETPSTALGTSGAIAA